MQNNYHLHKNWTNHNTEPITLQTYLQRFSFTNFSLLKLKQSFENYLTRGHGGSNRIHYPAVLGFQVWKLTSITSMLCFSVDLVQLILYLSLEFEKNENTQKEAGVGPHLAKIIKLWGVYFCVISSVTRKNRQMSIKVAQKWFY